MVSRKLDEPIGINSLEMLARVYDMEPENKRKEVSSQFGGHQHLDFYQGMLAYTFAVAFDSNVQSYVSLAQSASTMVCAIADGVIHGNLGGKQKVVAHSLLDDDIGEEDFKKALQTSIPSSHLERMEVIYGRAQSLSFYDGMFRAAVLVFTTAYKEKEVRLPVLDSLMFNYAYLAKLIYEKRKVS